MTRIRLAAVGLLWAISSNAWADLRTFDVDVQYREEVFSALRNVLVDNPQFLAPGLAMGRVSLLPSGQILVDADPKTLEQVDAVLRAVKERPASAAPRVSLRYWAVLGVPAGASGASATIGAPVPSVLNGVLEELKRFHGELAFRVLGTAAAVTESGRKGGVDGTPLSVEQTAFVQGQTLNANIKLQLRGGDPTDPRQQFRGELDVRTTLKRGEFVVLGESTQRAGALDGTLFYIVHWPENQ